MKTTALIALITTATIALGNGNDCRGLYDIDYIHCRDLNRAFKDMQNRESKLRQNNQARQATFRNNITGRSSSSSVRSTTKLASRSPTAKHANNTKNRSQNTARHKAYRAQERSNPRYSSGVRETKLYRKVYGRETVTD